MSNGSPCQHIHNVEPDRIIRLKKTDVLLGAYVTGLEMGLAVLLRQALFRDILPLEVEKHEAAQEEREARAEADDQRRTQLSTDRARSPGCGPNGSDRERVQLGRHTAEGN